LVERALRFRATVGDPVAPFLEAPCHQAAAETEGDLDTRVAIEPR
jgi:hypothetical protein